jgi:hypothetical protein
MALLPKVARFALLRSIVVGVMIMVMAAVMMVRS